MRLRLIAILILLFMTGCDPQSLLRKFASPEDEANAKKYIDCLRSGNLAEIEKHIDPSLKTANLHQTLARLHDLIPDQQPTSVTLVGAHIMHYSDGVTTNLTFEYGFSGKWFLLNVATLEKATTATIVGLNAYPRAISLEEEHQFGLKGKTPAQYLALVLAVILPLFTFYALVICLKTKIPKRKWLWIVFIVVGIGKFAVNWTTGEWHFASLAIQLFSASAFAQLYGPWTVAVSLPLGAFVFLLKRKSFREPNLTVNAGVPAP